MSTKVDIDPLDYRQVFGHLPTGVTVVATIESGRPVGLTVGAVFSVSLDPPLIGLCIALTSTTWPSIERTGRFAVSILGDHQQDVCRVLSTKDPDKFAHVQWQPAPRTGSPYVHDAVAHIDCELEKVHSAGDHWIVIGRVRHLVAADGEVVPMVFCRGAFGRHAVLA